MDAPPFLFVDGIKPDRATLRRIRSHAMRGKNARRVLPPRPPRPPRPAGQPGHGRTAREARRHQNQLSLLPASADKREAGVLTPGEALGPVSRGLGNAMRTHRFPFELTPAGLDVITKYLCCVTEKLYPPRLGIELDMFRTVWLRTMLADEAALHCGLALMEACNDFFCGSGNAAHSPEGLWHLSRALALVNERLSGDAALSDATIALVVLLILHEQVSRKEAVADIHFRGLIKMVELRGGMDQLEANDKALVLKICKLDISSAWQSGRLLHFFRHGMAAVQANIVAMGFGPYWRTTAGVFSPPAGLRPELAEILHDAAHVAGFLNTAPGVGHRLSTDMYQEMVISLASRLLRLDTRCDPDDDDDDDDDDALLASAGSSVSDTDATCHIGLTLFAMTLFLQLDRHRLLSYPRIVRRLRRGDNEDDDENSNSNGSKKRRDEAWLTTEIRNTTQQLGMADDWIQVHNAIRVLPWVDALHKDLAGYVWNLVLRG
ncbi:hypothetical protein SPI_05839 [Niveomyces insectorum RCEF 264]|uniref:Tachykinin family protein n=1 Tax=Niveomyces insectorum RCEF 264 TaxID=1081102 RepID=A0A167SHX5_9HYPO|nr:hypothetical protein SPI_05839 [Niveomyces insectorum RCEF 264]